MRKILILLVCLLGTGFAQAADAQPKGYSKVESKLDTQWEKICNGTACTYTISLSVVEYEGMWIRLYLSRGAQGLIVDTPKDSYLSRGIGLKGPTNDLGTTPYVRCRDDACYAWFRLSNADIAVLDQDTTFVVARDWTHSVGIPVSFKGLRAMLDDIAPK
jgi:invasion protein IalB